MAVYEALPLDDKMRALILDRAPAGALAAAAVEAGMPTLRRSALIHMARGTTSMDEVIRNT